MGPRRRGGCGGGSGYGNCVDAVGGVCRYDGFWRGVGVELCLRARGGAGGEGAGRACQIGEVGVAVGGFAGCVVEGVDAGGVGACTPRVGLIGV